MKYLFDSICDAANLNVRDNLDEFWNKRDGSGGRSSNIDHHKNIRKIKLGSHYYCSASTAVRQQVVPDNMHKSILLKRDITNLYGSISFASKLTGRCKLEFYIDNHVRRHDDVSQVFACL